MNDQQAKLQKFFAEKAKHLQSEIDLEIEKLGGEDMLISREDLFHWVYHARNQIQTYNTICRMLEDSSGSADASRIVQDLREEIDSDYTDIMRIRRQQEDEQRALAILQEEAEYYRQALELFE